jgi:hypothetical protein
VRVMSSVPDALLPSGASASPSLRGWQTTRPTLGLDSVFTRSVALGTGARRDIHAERLTFPSRFGRHRRTSVMQVRLTESYLSQLPFIPATFPQFRNANATLVTHPHPKVTHYCLLSQKLYRAPASTRRPLSAANGTPKSGEPNTPPTWVTFVWFSTFDDRTFSVTVCG